MSKRLSVLLVLALLASSLWLVQVSYRSRMLNHAIFQAEQQALRLDAERELLEAERRAQATPMRVQQLAREKLSMQPASPSHTLYIELPAGIERWPASQGPQLGERLAAERSALVASGTGSPEAAR
ncbi:cell division protein FtsL [Piscinibacter sp. Jin2]|uniref:Cell division protein FtsL n=1 Tax=Aquariibacter lacus TaxID=2801332 RepID=A0A9X1BSB3_9BURK|nr:cell division protein FtsL [Piscinibacter lacus]MBL0720829.1 cell division protein FtsL [Piscinibacter lacus]